VKLAGSGVLAAMDYLTSHIAAPELKAAA